MLKKLAIVMGLFVAMSPGLPAQEIVAMHVNIPFDFRMGDTLVPSGTYLLQVKEGAVTLREEGGQLLAAALMTIPESRVAEPADGELLFHRYGNDYFLATIWIPDSKNGCSLRQTRREKEVARLAGGLIQTAAIHLQ
jgi:hypothetical protein